jgi:GT2 family glycosyltransferase
MDIDASMKLSIIIVNWNVKNLLKGCLNSIYYDSFYQDSEIILVDNDSKDGSVEMIQREFPLVRLIKNRENIGFGRACNQGIGIAEGKYIFILNPDTLVKPHTLQNIVNFMESNPKVGIGGCYVYCPDSTPQTSFYKFPTLLSYFSRMLSLFRILPRNKLTQKFFWEYTDNDIARPVDRVLGGAMVLRKEMVDQMGAFDETYFLYAEELDMCYRAKLMGWEVAAIPHAEIIHYHQQSTIQNIRQATFHTFKSDFLFFRKFYPVYQTILFRTMQFLGIFFRLLAWGGIYLFTSAQTALAKEKLSGYIKLLLSNFDYSKSLIR